MVTKVSLPIDHQVEYPDRCVACSLPNPGERFTLKDRSYGWLQVLFWWWLGNKYQAEIPVCNMCRGSLVRYHWLSRALFWGGLIVGSALTYWWFTADFKLGKGLRFLNKFLVIGIFLLGLVPFFIYRIFLPPPVDVNLEGDKAIFDFRDADYAVEFARLNEVAVVPSETQD